MLLAATSVAATIGIIAPLSHLVPAESTVTSMIVLIGMAVGVDYSLFYLKREREERARGRSTLDAVEIAAQTSGHSILVSGGAVIAAMAGLFLMTDTTFNSLAVGSILVVAIAVLGSITVLPALLAKLGRWVDRPRVPLLWRFNRRLSSRLGQGGISRRLLGPVLRHPVAALLVGRCRGGRARRARAGHEDALGQPRHAAGRHRRGADDQGRDRGVPVGGSDRAGRGPGRRERPGRGRGPARRAEPGSGRVGDVPAAELAGRGRRPTAVRRSSSSPCRSRSPTSRSTTALRLLRGDLVPASVDLPGSDVAVGGDPAESLDAQDRMSDRLPLVIAFVLLLTFLMMVFAFKSVPIALDLDRAEPGVGGASRSGS